MQRFTSNVFWTCPDCDRKNSQEISVPELNFAAEKSSDMNVDDWIEIMCDGCKTAFTGTVWVNPFGTNFEIEEPHAFSFSGDTPMYELDDDEYNYVPPDNPHSIAREALDQLDSMVGSQSPVNDSQFTNRLIFAGAISCLEAYLGDTLINAFQNEPKVRSDLLENNKELGGLKVTAAELVADSEFIIRRIVKELRGILYHNLRNVTALYRDAFGIALMPSKIEGDTMFRAMLKRHDCVHRNGRSPEGKKSNDFTDDYLREVIATIIKVVDYLECERTKAFRSDAMRR